MANHPNRKWRKQWRVQPLDESFLLIDLAKAIKDYREKRGLTQFGLSARLGVDKRTVTYWESGTITPPPYILLALSALE